MKSISKLKNTSIYINNDYTSTFNIIMFTVPELNKKRWNGLIFPVFESTKGSMQKFPEEKVIQIKFDNAGFFTYREQSNDDKTPSHSTTPRKFHYAALI